MPIWLEIVTGVFAIAGIYLIFGLGFVFGFHFGRKTDLTLLQVWKEFIDGQ